MLASNNAVDPRDHVRDAGACLAPSRGRAGAARGARSDADRGNGGLKGLAFNAGKVNLKNSSTAWIDKITSTPAAPRQLPATTRADTSVAECGVSQATAGETTDTRATPSKRGLPGTPAGHAMREAGNRPRFECVAESGTPLTEFALADSVHGAELREMLRKKFEVAVV